MSVNCSQHEAGRFQWNDFSCMLTDTCQASHCHSSTFEAAEKDSPQKIRNPFWKSVKLPIFPPMHPIFYSSLLSVLSLCVPLQYISTCFIVTQMGITHIWGQIMYASWRSILFEVTCFCVVFICVLVTWWVPPLTTSAEGFSHAVLFWLIVFESQASWLCSTKSKSQPSSVSHNK